MSFARKVRRNQNRRSVSPGPQSPQRYVEHRPTPLYASRGKNPARLVGYSCECGTILTATGGLSQPTGRTGKPGRNHGLRLRAAGLEKPQPGERMKARSR